MRADERELLQRLLNSIQGQNRAEEYTDFLEDNFGTLIDTIESMELQKKCPQITPTVRSLLMLVPKLYKECAREKIPKNIYLNTFEKASRFLPIMYAGAPYEQVGILCLDSKLRLIEACLINEGGLNDVALYPRRILQEAAIRHADALILCHNHPGAWCFFSESDVSATNTFLEFCAKQKLSVVDHMLLAGARMMSMRSRAFIEKKKWESSGPYVPPLAQWRIGSNWDI